MLKMFINLIKNKFKLIFIFIYFIFSGSYAIASNNVIVEGNEYIDNEVIFSIIGEPKNKYSDNEINDIIKSLYSTGNFKKVEIVRKDQSIIIKIIENPIINKINFYGNKRFKKDDLLEQFDKVNYLNNYNEFKIDQFIDSIKDLYYSFGYNLININHDISKIEDEKNIVDINFYFEEGEISKINKIYFSGNNSMDRRELLSVIKSKQKNLIRFTSAINFKKYQVNNDTIKIKKYYLNRGYRDVKVEYKTEFISKNNRFNIYFFIEEGSKYSFNKIDLNQGTLALLPEQFQEMEIIKDNIISKSTKKDFNYNKSMLSNIKDSLSDFLFNEGYVFFKIKTLDKVVGSTIDILFLIDSSEPKIVNQINIFGNDRTQEMVIRREISFSEGDAFNDDLIRISNRKIEKLGIFKSVSIDEKLRKDGSYDIDIEVEETSTGEFQAGVAFGTLEGATLLAGLKEKNIAGAGREIDATINTSSGNTVYNLGVVEPYAFNRDIDFIIGTSYRLRDYSSNASYELTTINLNTGFRYELTDQIDHKITIDYNVKDYAITDSNTVSSNIATSAGTNVEISINNNLVYNNLNSLIRPSEGTFISFNNSISPVTNDDNGYLQNILVHKIYYKQTNNVFSIQTKLGNIISLQNSEIKVDNKFALGGRWLRGFDSFGAGPRDSRTSYYGGRNIAVTKLDYQRPIFKNSENPVDLNLFLDAGTVFDNKKKPNYAKESIRSSFGAGVKFYSPIGPIGFSWAFPIQSETYDIERMFLFSVGNLN